MFWVEEDVQEVEPSIFIHALTLIHKHSQKRLQHTHALIHNNTLGGKVLNLQNKTEGRTGEDLEFERTHGRVTVAGHK